MDSHFDDVPPPEEPAEYFDGSGDRFAANRQRGKAAVGQMDLGRQLPANIEAEQAVLGGMMANSAVIADVYEILRPEDFYRPAHQTIYQAILHIYGDSSEVDPILVAGRLDKLGELERIGGGPYLHTLVQASHTSANSPYYARLVAEKATVRRLVTAGSEITELGYHDTDDVDPDMLVDQAQQIIFGVGRETEKTDYSVLGDLMDPTLAEIDEIHSQGGLAKGVGTGFSRLDDLTNGLHGGQMIIVAARPGVGKSTLAMDFMRACSIKAGKASVIFSLEMSKIEIMMRILSAESKIGLSKIRSGKMVENDWARMVEVTTRIQDAPLFIDDSPNMTMMEIRAKARQLKQKHDLGLIVVDYLQLMTSGKKVESRQQEVSEFSRQLKLLAKELDVPLVAISQLNRGPEARTDKKPQVADLRESGSLEQDADMVMLLYRPDSQEEAHERAGEADIILAKHRGGPIGTITVASQLNYSRFVDLAPDPIGDVGM